MRIGDTRYRWEFRLLPGETAADFQSIEALLPLIGPWVDDIPCEQLELVRVAEYTFRAQLADRWRDRNVFLLGDAAHLTPPFIGQGMGAGVRDAMNLSWKIAGVLTGDLPEPVLDTYEVERKPHARAMIQLARLIGVSMTQGGRAGDLLRGAVAPRLHWVPGLRDRLLDGQTPPLRRSALVNRRRVRRSLNGRLCPNSVVADDIRYDDVTARRVCPRDQRAALAPAADAAGRSRDRGARSATRLAAVHVARRRQRDGRTGAPGLHGAAGRPRRRRALRRRPQVPRCPRNASAPTPDLCALSSAL